MDGVIADHHSRIRALEANPITAHYEIKVNPDSEQLAAGDGAFIFMVPVDIDGFYLTDAQAYLSNTGSTVTTIQLKNLETNLDLLETAMTIDALKKTTYRSNVRRVIDLDNAPVLTGDLISIDVDTAGPGASGLGVILVFAPSYISLGVAANPGTGGIAGGVNSGGPGGVSSGGTTGPGTGGGGGVGGGTGTGDNSGSGSAGGGTGTQGDDTNSGLGGGGPLFWFPPGWNQTGDVRNPDSFPGYTHITLNGGAQVLNLDDNTDYYITVGNVSWNQTSGAERLAIQLVGGRNRVIVGGSIVGHSSQTNGNGADPTAFLLDGGNASGITHIEGCYIDCVNGFTIRGPQTYQFVYNYVQVATIGHNHDDAHPDIIQIWDQGASNSRIRVDYLTAYTDYTGLSVLIDNPVSWTNKHVDISFNPGHSGPAVYYGDGKSCTWSGEDCWFEPNDPENGLDDSLAGWGTDNAAYKIFKANGTLCYTSPDPPPGGDSPPPCGFDQGDYITYYGSSLPMLANMRWNRGSPGAGTTASNGHFVARNNTGPNYVPLGYV